MALGMPEIPESYVVHLGCHNCLFCAVEYPCDDPICYYCNLSKTRPEYDPDVFSAKMMERWAAEQEGDWERYSMLDLFIGDYMERLPEWQREHEVHPAGICGNWKRKSP